MINSTVILREDSFHVSLFNDLAHKQNAGLEAKFSEVAIVASWFTWWGDDEVVVLIFVLNNGERYGFNTHYFSTDDYGATKEMLKSRFNVSFSFAFSATRILYPENLTGVQLFDNSRWNKLRNNFYTLEGAVAKNRFSLEVSKYLAGLNA